MRRRKKVYSEPLFFVLVIVLLIAFQLEISENRMKNIFVRCHSLCVSVINWVIDQIIKTLVPRLQTFSFY